MRRVFAFIGVICCSVFLTAQKSVYMWKDEKGVPHISDEKPEGAKDVQEMKYAPPKQTNTENQPKDGGDDFFRSLEEEKAKRRTERAKDPIKKEAVQARENYERLKVDEEKLRKAARQNLWPVARRQAQEKLKEIEEAKQKVEELEKKEK